MKTSVSVETLPLLLKTAALEPTRDCEIIIDREGYIILGSSVFKKDFT